MKSAVIAVLDRVLSTTRLQYLPVRVRGWSIWDLGAHFGIYSVGRARRVGPTGAVAAFEPNPFSMRASNAIAA